MAYLNPNEISIVHWFPDTEGHKCGYCKSTTGSISNGMWAETMTIEDYQNLIDRGWRRSGKYCYKPIMNQTCCPQYTIRCNTLRFNLSKSQKKIIKKFNKYVNDGILSKEKISDVKSADDCNTEDVFQMNYRHGPDSKIDVSKIHTEGTEGQHVADEVYVQGDKVDRSNQPSSTAISNKNEDVTNCKESSSTSKETTKTEVRKGVGADPNKPTCKKAKLLRLERKQQKLLKRGMSLEKLNVESAPKSLEQFLEEISNDSKHKLRITLVSTSRPGTAWEATQEIEFKLYCKYQLSIHNDNPDRCTMHSFTKFLVNSPLKIATERMHTKHVHFKKCVELYRKYQMVVHSEPEAECNEEQFVDFLVDTPLEPSDKEAADGVGYGSYHQQYWIDDKLIAVGVIDILPKCISSVYFFYDPDYRNLTLGTYGCLRELHFTRMLHEMNPSIEYYYMGFYIHSCPKMRYKGKLSMSDLLCPETYDWFPIEKCIPKLEISKYSRLNDDASAVDKNACTQEDIDKIKVLLGYKFTTFALYKQKYGMQEMFSEIGNLVGKKCARSLLFVINN